jgi:hypothetical protein
MINILYICVLLAVITITVYLVTDGDNKTALKKSVSVLSQLVGVFAVLALVVYYLTVN